MLRILDTGVAAAEENMRLDREFLENLDFRGLPILHFYRWDSPSATYGHFVAPSQYFDLGQADRFRLKLAKRPTGGGIVFHIWDLAFSFLMPSNHRAFSSNTLSNYQFVNEAVLKAVTELFDLKGTASIIPENFPSPVMDCKNFCMAKPTQYDVVYQGMKIAGAAQRRTRLGYLHQGTISLGLPDFELLRSVLHSEQAVLDAMAQYTFAPLGSCFASSLLEKTRKQLQDLLTEKIMEKL